MLTETVGSNIHKTLDMYKILILLFLLTKINSFAQNEYQLKVRVSGNMPEFEYIIDVHRNSENSKIYFSEYTGKETYTKTDKIRITELLHKKDRTANENMEIMKLRDNSKNYSKECFIFSKKDPIIELSDLIISSKKTILNEIETNKNRVVLDAIQVKVTIKNKNEAEYSYNIHAPDDEHYKLFRQLVNESSKEFRVVYY